MTLEKSELFEPIETTEAENTFDAAPVRETVPAPVQAQREPPRKRYAPPSAPRVMNFMSSAGSADRVKA